MNKSPYGLPKTKLRVISNLEREALAGLCQVSARVASNYRGTVSY